MSSTDQEPANEPVYRVLGPLQVANGASREFRVPPGRQQIVLASLLLEANRIVSIDALIDAIWDDNPPATARTQVQICVSALRNNLARIDCGQAIATRAPGYRMAVADGQLDAQLFQRLVAEAEALARSEQLDEASRLFRQALALWRGPALSGTNSRILRDRATRLNENRLAALEARLDVELRLGRHHQLVGEIGALVREHPLRERLRGQLMMALYRAGRQAEALDTYRVGRELLIEQLGLEPGDALRKLEAAILTGDPALQPGAVTGAPAPRSTPGRSAPAPQRPSAEPDVVAPFQLPADIADFTGREDLVRQSEEALVGVTGQRATRVVVLLGKAGVGKSALAVHVAHRLRDDHFPDGQLYCDLSGTRAHPETAAAVLGRFLRALGVPGASIPDSTDERAETYRHLVARRRMLVVLDDAANEGQLRSLFPGSSSCAVVVTSRSRLTGLAGARILEVDVLDTDPAIGMLATAIGPTRVAEEPVAARALIRMVGGLPLALRIVAARLAARPHWSLAWMLERLSDERRRLDELAHGEMMVRASLALTYDGLEADARRLLRLLGLLDGLSFPTWVAAALLDTDLYHAADLLELLVDVQMVEVAALDSTGGPRYKFHDLIRIFAREQLHRDETDDDRRAALGRVAGGWLALAAEAHRRIYGGDYTTLHGDAVRWRAPEGYVERLLAEPLGWLESEHDNLCSMVTLTALPGLDEWCWDLTLTLVTLFEARCYFDDWERTHAEALRAVRAAGNRRGEAALLCSLGSLHLSRSRPHAAEEVLVPALASFVELGDVHGAALSRRNLALLDHLRGDTELAARRYQEAFDDFRRAGDPVGQAHVLGQLAQIELAEGDQESSAARLHQALAICRDIGNKRVEVQIQYRLSDLLMRQQRHQEAADILAELLTIVREGRDLVGESWILHRLGLVNARLGNHTIAQRLLTEAIDVREQILDPGGAAEARMDLASLLIDIGHRDRAEELVDQAVRTFAERNGTASGPAVRASVDSAGLR